MTLFTVVRLAKGPLDPHDAMRILGSGAYEHLLREVQRVYRQRGVDINDVEVTHPQMLSKAKTERQEIQTASWKYVHQRD